MHIQRFWWNVLMCLFLGYAVMGFYPFGTPVYEVKDIAKLNPFVFLTQFIGLFVMVLGGVWGSFVSLSAFSEMVFLKTVEEVHLIGSKRAMKLSRAAPLSIFGFVAAIINQSLLYHSGRISGLFAGLLIVAATCFLLMVVVAVRTAIFLAPETPE